MSDEDLKKFDSKRLARYPAFGLYFRRYAPFAKFGRANPYTLGFGGYFAGDNRGVSTSINVTSRTYGFVMFNRDGVGYMYASSSGTHFHPTIGDVIVGQSKTNYTIVRDTVNGPDIFGFKASTAGNNPLIKPSPDINTFISVIISFSTPNKLRITGEVFGDNFPNLEVFLLCYRSSRTALLLDGQTTGGPNSGPGTRLYGAHESFSLGKFSAALNLDEKGELSTNSIISSTKLPDYSNGSRNTRDNIGNKI